MFKRGKRDEMLDNESIAPESMQYYSDLPPSQKKEFLCPSCGKVPQGKRHSKAAMM